MSTLGLAALIGVAIVVSTLNGWSAWRKRRQAAGYAPMAVVSAGACWWGLMSMISLLCTERPAALTVLSLTYLGIWPLVAGWFVTARAITDRFWQFSRRTAVLLSIEPALCAVFLITDPWHHLFFTGVQPTAFGGALAATFGPLFWLQAAYGYALIAWSGFVIFRTYIRQTSRYGGYLLAIMVIIPSAAINLIGLFSGGRIVDLTAVGFAFSGPILMRIIRGQSLPVLAPVAHREMFQTMSDPVLVLDRVGHVVDHNPAAGRLLTALGLQTGRQALPAAFGPSPESEEPSRVVTDIGGTGADLSIRISELHDRSGATAGFILVARDITEQERQRRAMIEANARLVTQLETIEALRASLAEQAARDHLTGLYNRRYLMGRLADWDGTPMTVALVDIDHFKQINDTYGHAAGDEVLVRVAAQLRAVAGPGELVARYGGEEFALVLRGPVGEAVIRLNTLRRTVARTVVPYDGAEIRTTFSCGVADGAGDPVELIRAADLALYAAKAAGRNRVEQAAGHHAAGIGSRRV